MKRNYLVLAAIITVVVMAIAIACISRKRFSKEFSISSNPPGAEILVDGAPVGNSPLNVRMDFEINLDYPDRGLISHEVTAKKEGYLTKSKRVYHNDPPRVHFELDKAKIEAPPPPPPPPRQP